MRPETAWLLEVAKDTKFYAPVLLAVTTGMRRGEFLALHIVSGAAAVRRSVEQNVQRPGVRFKSPKGRKGRSIALLQITIEALWKHQEVQAFQRKAIGAAYQDDGLVCAQEDGSLWKPDTFTTGFRRLAKAGLKGVRLHDLRHSHATQSLMQGIHPKVVSERLGHSTVGITLDMTPHVLPGLQEDAARSSTFHFVQRSKNRSRIPGLARD